MTIKETAKLEVATNDISTIKDDIKEIKDILAKQESRFITRLEGKAAGWVIGAAFSILTLFAYFRGVK